MKVFRHFAGAPDKPRDVTVRHGATTVNAGALVIRGATPGTNGGMAIVGAGALADVIGVLLEEANSSTTDSNIDGSAEIRRKVVIAPFSSILADYSQGTGDDVAVTSSSGTTITVGSLEDDIDGGFILVVNSTNSNLQLRYLTASAAGSATMKSALGTNLTSSDNIIKILPRLHQLAVVNTAATMLSTSAAAGSARVVVVENYIKDIGNGLSWQPLDPVLHSPLTLGSLAKVSAEITLSNLAYFPFD